MWKLVVTIRNVREAGASARTKSEEERAKKEIDAAEARLISHPLHRY